MRSLSQPLVPPGASEANMNKKLYFNCCFRVAVILLVLLGVTLFFLNLPCMLWQMNAGETYTDFAPRTIESVRDCIFIHVHQTYTFPKSKTGSMRVIFDAPETALEGHPLVLISYDSANLSTPKSETNVTDFGYSQHMFDLPGNVLIVELETASWSFIPGYKFYIYTALCDSFIENTEFTFESLEKQNFSSPHEYCDNLNVVTHVTFTHPDVVSVYFDGLGWIADGDELRFRYLNEDGEWIDHDSQEAMFTLPSNEVEIILNTDESGTYYGYHWTLDPRPCAQFKEKSGTTLEITGEVIHIESPHPYCNDLEFTQHFGLYSMVGSGFQVFVDEDTSMQEGQDFLEIAGHSITSHNVNTFFITDREFDLRFTTDNSVTDYGYKLKLVALFCADYRSDQGATFRTLDTQTIESDHDYCNDMNVTKHYSWTDSTVTSVFISMDPDSNIDENSRLTFSYTDLNGQEISTALTGSHFESFVIESSEFDLNFSTGPIWADSYGYKISMFPGPAGFTRNPIPELKIGTSHIVESSHPYANELNYTATYSVGDKGIPIDFIQITFDNEVTSLEKDEDFLIFSYYDATEEGHREERFTGSNFEDVRIPASEFVLTFIANSSVTDYGYRFTAKVVGCLDYLSDIGASFNSTRTEIIETPHDYCRLMNTTKHYSWTDPEVTSVFINLGADCDIDGDSLLTLRYKDSTNHEISHSYTGSDFESVVIEAPEFYLDFVTGESQDHYGYKIWMFPGPGGFTHSAEPVLDTGDEHIIESSHPYGDNLNHIFHYRASGTHPDLIKIRFDPNVSSLEENKDFLIFHYFDEYNGREINKYFTGNDFEDFDIEANDFYLWFTSDNSGSDYGYRFTAQAYDCYEMTGSSGATWNSLETQVVESCHDYCYNMSFYQIYIFTDPTVDGIAIDVDYRTQIGYHDGLTLDYSDGNYKHWYDGNGEFIMRGAQFRLYFWSDSHRNYWGYKFTARPLVNYFSSPEEKGSINTKPVIAKLLASSMILDQTFSEDY
mmetsp:Transcript_41200/g.47492  ORF Transcript_41200/g.47492 Transcript_41200/m.47492 type:complete len:1007 (-) Transcript_41200:103-3123(-)